MVEMPLWMVVVLEQGAIVLMAVAVFFYLRARRLKNQFQDQPAEAPAQTELSPDEALQHKVAVYEKRLKSLERFRDLFFELKDRQGRIDDLHAQMHEQVGAVDHESEEFARVKQTMEQLQQEKANLEEHLKQVTDELDVIMGVTDHATASSDLSESLNGRHEQLGGGLDNIKNMVDKQKREIAELHQQIADLEIEKASADELRGALDALVQRNEEMTLAVEVIQDENQYLQEQVEQMVAQQGQLDGSFVMEIDSLRRELEDKEQAYSQLEKKFADMEANYIELYEKSGKGRRATG